MTDDLTPTPSKENPLEAHRGFIRQQHERLERVYAYGGLSAVVSVALVIMLFWIFSTLSAILPWVFACATFFVALYGVKKRVTSTKARLLLETTQYCQINGVVLEQLRQYYSEDRTYPFFLAIFEGKTLIAKES